MHMLFSGKGDLTKLAGQTSENGKIHPIAKVIASGKFVGAFEPDGVF